VLINRFFNEARPRRRNRHGAAEGGGRRVWREVGGGWRPRTRWRFGWLVGGGAVPRHRGGWIDLGGGGGGGRGGGGDVGDPGY